MSMKTCTKCGQEKPLSEFYKNKNSKDGLRTQCKSCVSEYYKNKSDHYKNLAKIRREQQDKGEKARYDHEYYENNKDKLKQYQKDYNKKNKEKVSNRYKEYYEKNKEKIQRYSKEYQENNRDLLVKKSSEYQKKRRKEDPVFAMKQAVRARVNIAFRAKGYTKRSQTYEMLGCTFEELKAHLEKQFTDGMTWDNRGDWHIDHIIPLASATNELELIELCNYKNLQPLWAEENLTKGAKVVQKGERT